MTPETESSSKKPAAAKIAYRTAKIDGLDIFYREAGPQGRPRRAPAPWLPHQFAHVP